MVKTVVELNERPAKPEPLSDAYTQNGLTDEMWAMVERCMDADPNRRPSARSITEYEFML